MNKSRPAPSSSAPAKKTALASFPIVGIGASAGGLEAFTEFVKAIPPDTDAAFVLVQHLDPNHKSLLTELLARASTLPVREIETDTELEPRQIYVIPPNCDLSIEHGVLELSPRQKNAGPARSIDHFLRALAADQGQNAIAVILSGAGSDGAKGLKAIKEAGGTTFAQDEDTAKYDSMPRSAVATEGVDYVLAPAAIALEIDRLISARNGVTSGTKPAARPDRNLRRLHRDGNGTDEVRWENNAPDEALQKLFLIVREKAGLDFSLYRINTVRRRVARRMAAHRLNNLNAYTRILAEDPAEVDALYQDLLIGVTSFFRNPAVFETLKKKVFPKLIKNREGNNPLRFWVVGCSTGQEPYSLAMAFLEFCEKEKLQVPLQIFASDVNPAALSRARLGHYSAAAVDGLSTGLIKNFFQVENDGYRVQKRIRDLVVFAEQNLLTDPPFTRVDLISCRNMLIYIEPLLQQRIIPSFYYALRPHGCLVLGTSESLGSLNGLFSPGENKQKIFFKRPGATPPRPAAPGMLFPVRPTSNSRPAHPPAPAKLPKPESFSDVERALLQEYTPPAVVVNEAGDVLQFRGKVQPYLKIPSGKATLNVIRMAKDGLAVALQRGLRRATSTTKLIRETDVPVARSRQRVTLAILPFKNQGARCFLILFEAAASALPKKGAGKIGTDTGKQTHEMRDLRRDYAEARESLDTLQEQHGATVEELQASGEEVQSANEELQSLNEELETSNEELESANEELTTLNEELSTRNVELLESEQRLREQAQLVELAPLIVRSSADRIIFWNRGAEALYGYTKEEAVGNISHLLLAAKYPAPIADLQAEFSQQGRWTGEVTHRRKDGVELTVAVQWVSNSEPGERGSSVLEMHTDVTARAKAERDLHQAQELNQRVLQSSQDCIVVFDLAGRVVFVNAEGQRVLGWDDSKTAAGTRWVSLWDEAFRETAEEAYRVSMSGQTRRFQGMVSNEDKGRQWFDVVLQPILDTGGQVEQLLAVARDITERKNSELKILQERRITELRADVALEIARGGDLFSTLQQLAQVIIQHTDAVSVRVWLAEENPVRLKLYSSEGLFSFLNSYQEVLALGEARIGAIAESKRPYTTHTVELDPEICDPVWARREGLTSFTGYPLLFESKLLGVLAVMSRERLEAQALKELALSADAIALLIQRKHADFERSGLLDQANQARVAAETASRAKDDFIATLSHELRTPLNPVLMLASDSVEDIATPPHLKNIFATIRDNITLEARLIDDLLDITRIASGKLSLELKPVNLNDVAAAAAKIVFDNPMNRAVTLSVNLAADPSIVQGDATRLQQVVWNMLNNAVKYSSGPGSHVSLRSSNLPGDRILLRVTDSGIGIKKEDLPRIFSAFSQLEHGRGGLGLGLAISKQLVEQHKGTIRVASEGLGKGSTFEVELPLSAISNVEVVNIPAFDSQAPFRAKGQIRVLLVEDHQSTRQTLTLLLSTRGFQVSAVGTAQEARAVYSNASFDLVISDIGLPDEDGVTLLGTLYAIRAGVPAIAMSGYGMDSDRERTAQAGFDAHLTKPVSMAALDAAISAAIGVAKENR